MKATKSINLNNIFLPFLIIVIGVVSLIWSDKNIVLGDFNFPPDRILEFNRSIYSWDHLSLGSANFGILGASLPRGIFLLLTKLVGLSLVTSEKLWIYLSFTSMGLSMYFLVITTVKEKFRYWAGFCAALLFMFNPWNALVFAMIWQYVVFLPLILGLYIKGLNENRGIKYILLFCFVWMVTCNSGLINIRAALHQWIFLLMYLIFFLVIHRKKDKVKQALIFTGKLFLFWVTLNIYWLLPLSINFSETIKTTTLVYQSINFSWLDAYRLNSVQLIDAFRLMGCWAMHQSYKGYPYFYWTPVFKTPLFIFIGFILPLVAFSSLLLFHRFKRSGQNLLFFVLVGIWGLFVMNGVYGICGKLNLFFVQYVPFFSVLFSVPYFFGGIFVVVSYSILVGVMIAWLWNCHITGRLCNYKKILSVVLAFLLIGVYGWPIWSGEFIYPGNKILGSARYKIPMYYQDARAWLEGQENNFRIFALPYSKLGYMAYTWPPKGFGGPDPSPGLLNRDIITGVGFGLNFANKLAESNISGLSKLLGIMNVKYILIHNDANWEFIENNSWYICPPSKFFELLIHKSGEVQFVKSFGKLDFYKISDECFFSHIYSATAPTIVSGDIEALVSMSYTKYLDGKLSLLFTDQIPDTRYQIPVRDANNFIFKDSNWQDLAVEVAGYQGIRLSEDPGKINIKKPGIYEVYGDTSDFEEEIPDLEIEIGGKEIASQYRGYSRENIGRRYAKVGEVELEKGRHQINIKNQESGIKDAKQNLKIILVNKEERENLEKEVRERIDNPETEVCYIFEKEKAEFWVK